MKVLIMHFRSGPGIRNRKAIKINAEESAGTDGVSLEMTKRAHLLADMGHEVALSSAYNWSDIPIPELEFESTAVVQLMRGLFDPKQKAKKPAEELERTARSAADELLEQFRRKIGAFRPDLIFVHNIFSLPVHPAATEALGDFVRESGIPCAAIHHDVRSEGAYKFTPTCHYARLLLVDYFPPELPNLRHFAINTMARDFFVDRGIPAGVIHDTLDFGEGLEAAEKARLRVELRRHWGLGPEDIVLLLSTRIVPNKQAEIAGSLCREIEAAKREFVGKTLYNGVQVSENSRIVLVIAGRPERAFHSYRDAVFQRYEDLSIAWKYVGDSIMPVRNPGSHQYTLYPDSYAAADFALYPTRWEGFGNQFLEIIASGLPAAVYEYPIFKRDLAPLGFDFVTLGDRATRPGGLAELPTGRLVSAAREIWEILIDGGRYRSMARRNLSIGSAHFGLPVLRKHLQEVVDWAKHRAERPAYPAER